MYVEQALNVHVFWASAAGTRGARAARQVQEYEWLASLFNGDDKG